MRKPHEENPPKDNTPISEKDAIAGFYKKSENFKSMVKLCYNDVSQEFKSFIADIKKAETFSKVLASIDAIAPDLQKDPTTQKMNTALNFFISFGSSDASFVYYLSYFREEVINFAVDNGFEMELATITAEQTLL